ncbi:hypothetical protein CC1G_03154 [Coprinopsis cinerea okayama7|uniref:Copper acquisition factor BIM1-like domain-containing protein n=1 Tax=Coprinopsis cinerea (strain Okayama-7 / 130 / ATCC MYA-4618 / FGSC 9003) TaxID=240176 RepID=A8PF48_COPC7|nr:hypothetical protein CC1G_03154 [Coprinopsis cinerea okayama7\|eukprot:XP_001840925.1 hypothetical protein CC1G_03154 [Coprinopsis cinerea okayama7\
MLFQAVTIAAVLATGANAHFRLLYPEPRGPFVGNLQPTFCGGYPDVTTNRTVFPLNGGQFRIRQGHEDWVSAVTISTADNPNSFDAFRADGEEQFVKYWAPEAKPGNFCIPLDIGAAGIPGVEDGANVTIQVTLDGPDGALYQCADLTLSSTAEVPEDLGACTNSTSGGHGASPSESGDGATPSGGADGGDDEEEGGSQVFGINSLVMGVAGVLAAVAASL